MTRPSRRTILLILLGVVFVCSALCGLSLLFAPDTADLEPTAQAAAVVEEPTATDEPPPAATATDEPTEPSPTAGASATSRSTRTPAGAPPTAAPTRTPRPRATPAPTRTAAPTRTPAQPTSTTAPTSPPLPTATLVPPTAALPTAPPPTATRSGVETATVTNVVDGDTIDVTINGAGYRVRYIGMNTPESNEVCGSEATAANAALVAGQTVTMVRDVSETDQYGRLLRYVYVGSTFVNGALVAGGWADAVDYPPDTAQSATLHSLMAQGAGRGCDLVAAPLPTQPVRGPEPIAPIGNCDPSYPDVCIPPAPPDLDCGDIPHRRFRVLPPDPHNFDGSDNDGIGCESD